MKVNVFFDRAGKPLHALYKDRQPNGLYLTMCQTEVPTWFRLDKRHAVNIDGLVLVCPACALELEAMLKKLEEQDNGIWHAKPAPERPPAGQNGQGVCPDTSASQGGQATAGMVRGEGGGVGGTDVHPGPVDGGPGDPVAAGGGAAKPPKVGATPRQKGKAEKRSQG